MTPSTQRRALAVSALFLLLAAACLGRQSEEARTTSEAVGDRSAEGPDPARREKDWTAAATGHDAAGAIPKDVLERMEKKSAPGGGLGEDAAADASRGR